MAKTIYLQADETTLILLERGTADFYFVDRGGGLDGIIDGLSKDDIVVGFPISLEVTFGGKTIVKNLTCIGLTPIGAEGTMQASFTDSPESSQPNAVASFHIPVSGQVQLFTAGILKDYAESVFGQPSSEVVDDETTYYYEHAKIVISSVEEDSGSNNNNNMKVLKITDNYKMSKILRMTDGYYMVAQNPILLHEKDSEDVEEIPVGAIVCIRSEDSPFYPMKTITNCNNDVTYYITSIFQNKDVIEYSKKDNAADPISIEQLDDRFAKKVVLCHLEPPFENGEEERTEAYKALKNFIESELNAERQDRPFPSSLADGTLPMTRVMSYLWQLYTNWGQLSSSERAAYMAFCENTVPRYGVILEMADGRKVDIPPVSYRYVEGSSYKPGPEHPAVAFDFISELLSETKFYGRIYISLRDEDMTNVRVNTNYTCVLDVDAWKIDDNDGLSVSGRSADRIKSIDIYVIQ